MRKPTVKNKHNLTTKQLRSFVVGDRSKVCSPLFWRNDNIKAWCISGDTAKTSKDYEFCTYDAFWLGIYDDDADAYKGKFRFEFSTCGGMCGYKFDKFYNEKDIEYEDDLRIQELFLEKINYLIDEGILVQNNYSI